MVIVKRFFYFFTMVVFLLASCEGCWKKTSGPGQTVTVNDTDYHLSSKNLFKIKPSFSYSSQLNINLTQGAKSEANNEAIEILGKNGRVHLKKKIDSYHFFELIRDQDQFFIKNLAGVWRSGQDNKPYYKELIDDGFNLYSWLVENFALKNMIDNRLASGSNNDRLQITSHQIPSTAPIMKMLANIDGFNEEIAGRMSGFVDLDHERNLPKQIDLVAEINGAHERSAQIHAKVSLSFEEVKLDIKLPTVAEDEVLKTPVNIKPRFLELIGKSDSPSE